MTQKSTGKRRRNMVAQLVLGVGAGIGVVAMLDAPSPIAIDWPDASEIVAALPSPQVSVRISLIVSP